ncbi:hypothetical protein BCU00_001680 [Vibrio breoganii]|uniref:hypothetical protein n=1 Tax=Vibrio breoganii TaxID=553239 RepID=UPI001054625D|nr:hypothetical protein [Vibrio breoganii]
MLDNSNYDDIGTKGQRQNEIQAGRRHYVGDLFIPKPNNSGYYPAFNCRVILDTPKSPEHKPALVTILSTKSNKGDMTVTRHIEGMLKRGKITTDELIEYYHPAYIRGEIKDSNDCEEIWDEKIRPNALEVQTIGVANAAIKQGMLSSTSNFKSVMEKDTDELRSPLFFSKIHLPNVKNEYVMADAYIDKVTRENGYIIIDYINSKGVEKTMMSFPLNERLSHLSALHDYTFEYLVSRQKQRAKFAICISPRYMGTLAESVTAIALQISRRGEV